MISGGRFQIFKAPWTSSKGEAGDERMRMERKACGLDENFKTFAINGKDGLDGTLEMLQLGINPLNESHGVEAFCNSYGWHCKLC